MGSLLCFAIGIPANIIKYSDNNNKMISRTRDGESKGQRKRKRRRRKMKRRRRRRKKKRGKAVIFRTKKSANQTLEPVRRSKPLARIVKRWGAASSCLTLLT